MAGLRRSFLINTATLSPLCYSAFHILQTGHPHLIHTHYHPYSTSSQPNTPKDSYHTLTHNTTPIYTLYASHPHLTLPQSYAHTYTSPFHTVTTRPHIPPISIPTTHHTTHPHLTLPHPHLHSGASTPSHWSRPRSLKPTRPNKTALI